MGISNRHHFAWLTEALEAFERETGRLAAIRQRSGGPTLWCLARHARYCYPFVRKFNLYLLTVLEPVGK